MSDRRLPWPARALATTVPAAHRDPIVGDLRETHDRRRSSMPRLLAWIATSLDALLVACAFQFMRLNRPDWLRIDWRAELRGAVAGLWRTRAVTTLALTVLALGVAASATVFSVFNAVVLEPLPYPQAERLVALWTWSDRANARDGSSYDNLDDWVQSSDGIERAGLYYRPEFTQRTVTGVAQPYRIQIGAVDEGFFETLGVQPVLGRALNLDDELARGEVAVLSHAYWTSAFGQDADVVGRTIELDGAARRIIGVMGPRLDFPLAGTALWEPHSLWTGFPDDRGDRGDDLFGMVARLSPDYNQRRAQDELDAVSGELRRLYPDKLRGQRARLTPLRDEILEVDLRRSIWLLLAAGTGLFLAVCVNVGHLWVSRGFGRARELTLRMALGGGAARVAALLVTEAAVLSALAAAVGLALAGTALKLVTTFAPTTLPRIREVSLDATVVAATILIAAAAVPFVAWLPVARLARLQPAAVLRDGARAGNSRASRRTRRWFVVTQIALATFLLAGGVLLVRSLQLAANSDPGVEPGDLWVAPVVLPAASYSNADDVWNFYQQLIAQVRASPGVESAAALEDFVHKRNTAKELHTRARGEESITGLSMISDSIVAGAEEVLGLQLVAGRRLTELDRWLPSTDPAVVINRAMAEHLWPNDEAVGREFMAGLYRVGKPWLRVVGVVENDKRGGLDHRPIGQVFFVQPSRTATLVLRSTLEADALTPMVRKAVRDLDPQLAAPILTSAQSLLSGTIQLRRTQTYLVAISALAAVVLAMTGMFSALAESVAARHSEIGVRLALGGRPRSMIALLLTEGLAMGAGGIAVGSLAAFGASFGLRSFLFGVPPWDWASHGLAMASILALTAVASSIPAWRASRVDAIVSLGHGT